VTDIVTTPAGRVAGKYRDSNAGGHGRGLLCRGESFSPVSGFLQGLHARLCQ